MANAAGALAFMERYNHIKVIEQSKDQLIEDMLKRIKDLEDAYQREKLDRERETRFNREIQMHEMELLDQLSQVKTIMAREPFVVVLLDGDGIMFRDEFIQRAGLGGNDAAQKLSQALTGYIASNFPGITPKIITTLYINIKALKELYTRAGIVDDPASVDEFVRGFNASDTLFEIIDIGMESSKADEKIADLFQMYLYNCHCHQILVGCSRDFKCAQLLSEMNQVDRDLTGRVSLIEGIPFEKELEDIKAAYRVTKFPEIFRDVRVNPPVWAPWKSAAAALKPAITPSPKPANAMLTRTSTNTTTASTSTNGPIPIHASATKSVTNNNHAKPTNHTNNPDTEPEFTLVSSSKTTASNHDPRTIPRNKYGQRIDKVDMKAIPREELNRVKKMKLCNVHFLLGECPNKENCYHDHTHKLTKNERFILQAIARMTPCHYGFECDDPECIYGHRCPLSEPGRKDCHWGSNCRFDESAHGIDTNVVRVTKV